MLTNTLPPYDKEIVFLLQLYGPPGAARDASLETVVLKTGVEAPKPLVATVMLVLDTWMQDIPGVLTVLDLSKMARDSAYMPLRSRELVEAGFINETTGRLHRCIAEIIVAATEGEGLELRLVNPVASAAKT